MTVGNQENQQTTCQACKEQIKPQAKKCPHCGTDQSRFLRGFSTIAAVVGAILAVLSLVALGWNAAKETFAAKTASLAGTVASSDNDSVYFVVSNQGTRAGTIFDVVVEGPYTNETCNRKVTFGERLNTVSVLQVVEPGKTYAFVAKREGGFSYLPSTLASDALANAKLQSGLKKYKQCDLAISYIDSDNSIKKFNVPYHCFPQAPCMSEDRSNNKIEPSR